MNNIVPLNYLIARFAQRESLSEETARSFVTDYFDLIEKALAAGEIVSVKALGTFAVIQDKLIFTPDNIFADKVNEPFEMFSPVTIRGNIDETLLEGNTSMAAASVDSPVENIKDVSVSSTAITDGIMGASVAAIGTATLASVHHSKEMVPEREDAEIDAPTEIITKEPLTEEIHATEDTVPEVVEETEIEDITQEEQVIAESVNENTTEIHQETATECSVSEPLAEIVEESATEISEPADTSISENVNETESPSVLKGNEPQEVISEIVTEPLTETVSEINAEDSNVSDGKTETEIASEVPMETVAESVPPVTPYIQQQFIPIQTVEKPRITKSCVALWAILGLVIGLIIGAMVGYWAHDVLSLWYAVKGSM